MLMSSHGDGDSITINNPAGTLQFVLLMFSLVRLVELCISRINMRLDIFVLSVQ